MLIDADMHKRYWGEAVMIANYLQNILPTSCRTRTPYELWFSEKPNVENLHIFGSKVFAHIPKEHRRKVDEKARELTFVGNSGTSKGFRLLDTSTNKITISRDVVFIKEFKKNSNTIITEEVDKQDLNEDNLIEINMKNASPEIEDEISQNIEDVEDADDIEENQNYNSNEENEFEDASSSIHLQSSSTEDQGLEKHPQLRHSSRSNLGVPPNRLMAGMATKTDQEMS